MTSRVKTLAVIATLGVLVLSLAAPPLMARESAKGRWLKIRVYDDDSATPTVLVNLPMSVVTAFMRIAAKTDVVARVEASSGEGEPCRTHLKEIDLEELIQELQAMDPGQILEVEEHGRRVAIGIE